MTAPWKPERTGSLIERAAEMYGFSLMPPRAAAEPALSSGHPHPSAPSALPPSPSREREEARSAQPSGKGEGGPAADSRALPIAPPAHIDPARLRGEGLLVPGAPVDALAEEFRLVKRQLLLTARAVKGGRGRMVLVCSANPNEGKTYCAINLALSMAAERDTRVLLVDADFAKPDVMARLGLPAGPGLLDVLADPAREAEACVVATDIANLSILPAGTKRANDTELLASERTAAVLDGLLAADPGRVLIVDSPPALAASPASVLASHAGQVMLVVRADRTSEGDLRQAVGLLGACEHIQLVLNAVSHQPGGRRFGSYYGQEQAA